MVLGSSHPLREPFLHLCKIKSDVLPQFEMRNRVPRILAGPVIDERGWHSKE